MPHRPPTIIVDLDGTLIKHHGNLTKAILNEPELLNQTIEKLNEWEAKGCKIIILSGRKESMRKITEKQLDKLGIFYDQLILGVGGGKRILINDCKDDNTKTAFAINILRNKGISEIELL